MKIKKLLLLIIFCIIICTSIFISYKKNSVTISVKEIRNLDDSICKEQIENKSIFDVDLEAIENIDDRSFKQTISFKNNTEKQKIYMAFTIHLPQILIDEKIVSEYYESCDYGDIYDLDTVPIVEGAKVYAGYEITETPLSEYQKQILSEFKNIFYCEAYIDQYVFYLKFSPNGYEIISLEEFKKNTSPFPNGRLLSNLKKNSSDYKIVHIKRVK